jgi:hypothetical protein
MTRLAAGQAGGKSTSDECTLLGVFNILILMINEGINE